MNPTDLRPVADHLWQSTVFAAIAGLATLMLRTNRARLRYWLWLTASCKFLVPFSVLFALGGQLAWRTARPATQSGLSIAIQEVSKPFTAPASPASTSPAPPAARPSLSLVLPVIWMCGFAGIAVSWWVRWRRIFKAVRCSSPMPLTLPIPVRSSPHLLEPGVFGIYRPVLLLPEGIFQRLTSTQMQAIIAHELCHIRYRDNLTAAVHMFVETIFWFHPLVWWIGKRMIEERERACDEEVLRLGSDPQVYAEGILNVCRLFVESPLPCVSGVSGSILRNRIAVILANRATVSLSFAKKAALTVAGLAAILLPMALGMINAPAMRAQASPSGDSANAARPKFEVASIKPCNERDSVPAGKRGGGSGNLSPGTLRVDCTTVMELVKQAYVTFANGNVNPRSRIAIEGGPAWINNARYRIDAKADGPQNQGMMHGPALQRLLEDRFKLKIHRETREVPAYALTVAKSGSKLNPFQQGSCTPVDLKILEQFPPPPFPKLPPGESYCGGVDPNGGKWIIATADMNGPNVTLDARAMSIDDFIKHSLGSHLDRPVINQTGITGLFDFHLEFAPDETMPDFQARAAGADSEVAGPSIFTALQRQLGLRLEPAKGLADFLVIDQVAKPSAN